LRLCQYTIVAVSLLAVCGSLSARATAEDPERGPQEQAGARLVRPIDTGLGLPELLVHGFGHVGYQAEWVDPDDGASRSNNNFVLGGMDLFFSSELAEDFSFLSETLFEFAGTEVDIDVERLLLLYQVRDWLKFKFGRGHTPIGYWNQRYHHGRWLQTSLERPLIFQFDDHGGGLPMHFIGVEVLGDIDAGSGVFSYSVLAANGRGDEPGDVQMTEDMNDSKAVGLLLRFAPRLLPGSGFGVNGYLDRVPPMRNNSARRKSMREYIYGGHVYYEGGAWEFFGEVQWIVHQDRVSDKNHRSTGAYVQLARSFGNWTPYYRFDWLSVADADPFYVGLSETFSDTKQHAVGVRWDLRSFVAVKLNYRYRDAGGENGNAIALEASFAF